LSWARVAAVSVVMVVVGGGCVTLWTLGVADHYVMGHQIEFVQLVLRSTPVALVFPALAVLPFTVVAVSATRNNFLLYTRTRRRIRSTLVRLYIGAAVVTFAVFAIIMLTYELGAMVSEVAGTVDYVPGRVDRTPETTTTFSQLMVYGTGAYYAFQCVWFGVNAAAYAVLGLSCVLVIRQPVVALLLPWLVFVVVGFGMAVLGLEAFSPFTVAPANLTQLPMWMPMVPAAVLVLVAVGSALGTVWYADRLAVTA